MQKNNISTLFLLIVLGFAKKVIILCGKRSKKEAEKTTFLQQETSQNINYNRFLF